MKVRSIGVRTDLAIHLREGVVIDRGAHLILQTPDNPDYYGGNCLVLPSLSAATLPAWEARFREAHPHAQHRSFIVDGVLDAPSFDGYEVRRLAVLTAERATLAGSVSPSPAAVVLRPLGSDADWASLGDLTREVSGRPGDAFARYLTGYLASRRRWAAAGTGAWWGAFVDDVLVSAAGLFWDEGLGRFQDVLTAPNARRRGVASSLITAMGHHALDEGCHTLVIVTEDDSDAHRLYRKLGFVLREHYVDLLRTPDVDTTVERSA